MNKYKKEEIYFLKKYLKFSYILLFQIFFYFRKSLNLKKYLKLINEKYFSEMSHYIYLLGKIRNIPSDVLNKVFFKIILMIPLLYRI